MHSNRISIEYFRNPFGRLHRATKFRSLAGTRNFFADYGSPVRTDHRCYFRFSGRRIFFEKSGIPVFDIFLIEEGVESHE